MMRKLLLQVSFLTLENLIRSLPFRSIVPQHYLVSTKPSRGSANLKFSDQTLTYNGLNNAGVTTRFPTLGNGLRIVISNPSLLIHSATSNGTLMLGSLTLDDETKTNITIPNVKISPGQKYDLKLNFRTCTQNVTSNGLDWSYPATTSGGKTGIMKD